MKLKFTVLFALIVAAEVISAKVFYNWTFINPGLSIANRIFSYFSFFSLLFCGVLLIRVKRGATLPLGLVFLGLFALLTYGEIKPIDSQTNPIDIATLQTFPDGKKLVIRQYKNMKTNSLVLDTVLVKDVSVFRGLYERGDIK
jgi:hypothetical protein